MRVGKGGVLGLAMAAAMIQGPVHGQNIPQVPWAQPIEAPVAPVPYGPGERLEYQVKLGWFSVGWGDMTVMQVDTVRGSPSYHVMWRIEGGLPLARVKDRYESWIDLQSLSSLRFIQDIREVNYENFRHYEFFPGELRWEQVDEGEEGPLPTDVPQDDISFVYYARTLPLVVGETYTLDHYFKESGNPLVLKVLRKDRVEVPAGTFNTIVVQPIIKTKGLFSQGGEAEIHFSDDERRLVVQMKSKVPVVGHLSLHLREIEEGPSLRPLPPLASAPGAAGGSDPGNR